GTINIRKTAREASTRSPRSRREIAESRTVQPALLLRRCFVAVGDLYVGLELLVVLVAHDHANPLGAGAEMQRVIGAGPRGKPILAVDLFAIRLKSGEKVLLPFLADIRDRFAVGFYDLKVVIVHPDLAFEVTLALFQHFRGN